MGTLQSLLRLNKKFILHADPAMEDPEGHLESPVNKSLLVDFDEGITTSVQWWNSALSTIWINFKITGPTGAVMYENSGFEDGADSTHWDLKVDGPGGLAVVFFYKMLPLDGLQQIIQGNYRVETSVNYDAGDGNPAHTESFYLDYTYNYCYTAPVMDASLEFDCECSKVTSIDVTDYESPSVLTRAHSLYYPDGVEPTPTYNPVTVTTAVNVISPIYSGLWRQKIVSSVTYNAPNNFYVCDVLTWETTKAAQCDVNLCDAMCGIEKLNDRYLAVAGSDPKKANDLFIQISNVWGQMVMFVNAQKCGLNVAAAKHLAAIYSIGGFLPGCGCDDGQPHLIIPTCGGGGGATVVIAEGVGIVAPSTVSNGIITYTVALAAAYKNKIDALFNTSITGSTTPVLVSSTTDGSGNITYGLTIATAGITSSYLASLCVTNAKIAAGAVTAPKVSTDLAVTEISVPIRFGGDSSATMNVPIYFDGWELDEGRYIVTKQGAVGGTITLRIPPATNPTGGTGNVITHAAIDTPYTKHIAGPFVASNIGNPDANGAGANSGVNLVINGTDGEGVLFLKLKRL